MDDLINKNILIYRSEDVHVEFIDKRIEGDLNKVIWGDLENITFSLINIMNGVFEHSEAVSYFLMSEENKVRVGKRIAVAIPSESKTIDIKALTENFLCGIKKGDKSSRDLFHKDSLYDEIVNEEVRKFLSQNSNKQIKQDLKIEVCGQTMDLAGKFGQLDNTRNLDEPPQIFSGTVDGLIKHSRITHLKLESSKIVTSYFNLNLFSTLINLMQSEETKQFILQQKIDARGKKDTYLVSIEDITWNLSKSPTCGLLDF